MLNIFDNKQIARLALAQDVFVWIGHGREIAGGDEPSCTRRSGFGYRGQ
jgi:hypothetical protein